MNIKITRNASGKSVYSVRVLPLLLGPGIAQPVQWLGYGLEELGLISGGGREFFSSHRVQTGCGSHPASYPLGTDHSFPGGKAAEAWSYPPTSI